MRVVYKKEYATLPDDPFARARLFETRKEWEKAVAEYEKIIKDHPLHEQAYNRLMIIFRKQGAYQKEKSIIEKGIKAFEEFYRIKIKTHASKKVLSLSKAFMKSTGLSDKKGKPVYQKEPLGKWNKRLLVVKKRLK